MKYTVPASPNPTILNIADPVVTVDSGTPPPVNHAPVVNAGIDQSIVLPINSVTLSGKATDPDTGGTVRAYMWERKGGGGTIEAPNSSATKISGLPVGTNTFRLTATDDGGASGFDDINIIVTNSVVTPPPTGGTLVYSNAFDKDSDLDPFGTGQAGKSYIDHASPISGLGSFRSRPASVSSGCRGEMQGAKTPTKGIMKWKTKYHYIVQNSCHSFQFHPDYPDGASGSPALWHVNGKFVWRNWIGGKNIDHPCNFAIPKETLLEHQIEYAFGSNGYFRHFINGVKVCEWTGQVGNNESTYVKIGFNGNFDGNLTEATKSDISYDDFEVYSV